MGNAITEIRFVKADHLYGTISGFIDLGLIRSSDPDVMEDIWNSIEEIEASPTTDDFNLLADQVCGDSVTDNKYVSAETIESFLRRPLVECEADGYAELEQLESLVAAR